MILKKLPKGLILSFILGIVLILISPEDKELGPLLKLIYLHGALINSGLFLFSTAGVVGLISIFRSARNHAFLFAIEKTAIVFWVAATATGDIMSQLAWGGIFLGEPRFNATIIVSLISISIYFISTAAENPKIPPYLGLALAFSVWALMIRAGRVMHPDNPFSVSETSIRFYFIAITAVFLTASILTVRWLNKKKS